MKSILALLVLASAVVGAVEAADYTPVAQRSTAVTPYAALSVDVPVVVEPVGTAVITVPVTIVAKRKAVVTNHADCAQDFRPLVQGSGSVRTYCAGAL